MFEEEAEEYANNTRIKDKNTYISFPDESISEVQDFEGNYIDISERIIKTFKDASEFGYNKANEWHYVKDGDLPNNTNICLLYLGSWYNPTTGWYDNNAWRFEDDRKPSLWQDTVIAWKEIVLPKENEFKSEMFPEITLPEGSSEFINKVIADAEKRVKTQEYSLNYENGIFKSKDKTGKEFVSIDGKTWEESTSKTKGE